MGPNPTWSIDWREFVDINDTNFHTAVNMWCDHQADANATYGHISDWNVSSVTNMSSAIFNRADFNESIGNWEFLRHKYAPDILQSYSVQSAHRGLEFLSGHQYELTCSLMQIV